METAAVLLGALLMLSGTAGLMQTRHQIIRRNGFWRSRWG